MDDLIKDIEAYAQAAGLAPGTVIQRAAGFGGARWSQWQNGGSCSMRTAERIRAWMAANPPRKRAGNGKADAA